MNQKCYEISFICTAVHMNALVSMYAINLLTYTLDNYLRKYVIIASDCERAGEGPIDSPSAYRIFLHLPVLSRLRPIAQPPAHVIDAALCAVCHH